MPDAAIAAGRPARRLVIREAARPPVAAAGTPEGPLDPGDLAAPLLTFANRGVALDERKCKLTCRCGYFLSCFDHH